MLKLKMYSNYVTSLYNAMRPGLLGGKNHRVRFQANLREGQFKTKLTRNTVHNSYLNTNGIVFLITLSISLELIR